MCVKWVAWSPTQSKHPEKEAWSWQLRLCTPDFLINHEKYAHVSQYVNICVKA